jgi:hypothetical protein
VAARDSDDDPFEAWRFDDEFVRGAAVSEASAEERLDRLRRVDADHRRLRTQHELDLADVVAGRPVGRRGRRRRLPRFSTVIIIAFTLVIGISAVKDGPFSDEGGRSFLGGGTGDVLEGEVESGLPAAPVDEAGAPLGAPAAVPAGSGAHAFVGLQPDGSGPVAYDPCQPVHYVVNGATAPTDGAEGLLNGALAQVSTATGLRFVFDQTTSEPPSHDRAPVQQRYGDRWAPVLIAWSDEQEFPELAGDVTGAGGSISIEAGSGDALYVTGQVALDGPQLSEMAAQTDDDGLIASTIIHELGHLVGLDHVDDESQIMNPYTVPGIESFAAGDLAGLAELGTGECFPGV